jgi:hypothetical protein
MDDDPHHPPTRLLVLRERDFMLESARGKLDAGALATVCKEMDDALTFPDDEATLVLATIKAAWDL